MSNTTSDLMGIKNSKRKTFMNIHIPFLRNSLLFIIILVSLEIIRELPITLILRPFNFETFATTAYISASEDLLEAAAVPSLFLIVFSLISNYGNRVTKNKTLNILSTLSISGYAIPGVILAIAFITFIAWFDNSIVKYLSLIHI